MADGVTQSTQAPTQTQLASQHHYVEDTNLWGFLIPCNANNPNVTRINFNKLKTKYTVGRAPRNDIQFPKCLIVSSNHCIFQWDGVQDLSKSAVTVTDLSSNGTFINGERISESGKRQTRILHDGNEIAFGSYLPRPIETAHEDYRFIFRRRIQGAPADSLDECYDIQHVLGKGSFATVVKALHRTEGEWYAVKIFQKNRLRQGLLGDRRDIQQKALLREIDIMKRLHHPNICRYKDVFIEPNSMSLVMEYVKGGDLLSYLHKCGALPEQEVQYFAYQICDALHYVHDMGITHRDLKPDNILLTDDKPPIVKIADFGLAKMVDSHTFLHTMCGTPEYLAPEVVKGNDGYDQVVDSWSVGVIVFALLTSCTPFVEFPEGTDIATVVANRQVEWTVLHKEPINVSQRGEDFMRQLMDYDPSTRMTLTDARGHPWLAEQAAIHAGLDDPPANTQPSQEQDQEVASLPPETQFDSQAASAALDMSMRSMRSVGSASGVALSRMSIADVGMDTRSRVTQAQALPAIPEGGSAATPPHVAAEDADEPEMFVFPASQYQHDEAGGGSSQAGSSQLPHPVQRRADVIRRAQHKGIELPAPSQDMQARAAAELDDVAADPDPDPAVRAGDVETGDEGGEGKGEGRAAPLPPPIATTSRASGKRKASEMDLDPGSVSTKAGPGEIAADAVLEGDSEGTGARGETKRGRRGAKAADRSPSAKKARTGRARPAPATEEEKDVPGLALGRRRSSRLASPAKPKPARKT